MEEAAGFVVRQSSILWAAVSALVFAFTLHVSSRRGTMGPTNGHRFNWTTFAKGVFVAALLYCVDFSVTETGTFLNAPLLAMQMMAMELDAPTAVNGGVSELAFRLYEYYGVVLYFCAPGATLLAIGTYLSQFLSLPMARLKSLHRDTYVFSDLNTRTVPLAASVREHYRGTKGGVSLVFASVREDTDEGLAYEARHLGAICVEPASSTLWQSLSRRHTVHIILDSDDDIDDITRASALRNAILQNERGDRIPPIRIYAVTSLYGAEALLGVAEAAASPSHAGTGRHVPDVQVKRVDWTRSLVERTLDQYPLFLLGGEPTTEPRGPMDLGNAEQRYLAWEREMYANPERHVLIVGAGHVGMEFLRLALSYCRVGSCDDDVPMSFRFDVFDTEADPIRGDRCLSEVRFAAECPGAFEGVACTFHLGSVFGAEFRDFVERHADTISYVFVSLGDGLLTSRVAMQIRTMLEQRLVRRCAATEGQGRFAFASATRPLVIAVVDNDELAESLHSASEDGFDYRIETVGSDSQMYSYDGIFLTGTQSTEYQRRSSRASVAHKKYRLFAFARSRVGRGMGMQDLAIDWMADLSNGDRSHRLAQTEDAIRMYNEYVGSTAALGPGEGSHEWLLRMEHDRWSAYLLAEGFTTATPQDVETFFATGQPDQRHRLNIARLHPCLVPFEDLPELDKTVDRLYDLCEEACDTCPMGERCRRKRKSCAFQLMDDEYISI